MFDNGFVKVYRSILTWKWYTDPEMMRLYFHLLLTVSYEEGEYAGIQLKPGMRVCSYNILAIETGMSLQQVKYCIGKMKSRGIILYKPHGNYSVLTLCEPKKFSTGPSEI